MDHLFILCHQVQTRLVRELDAIMYTQNLDDIVTATRRCSRITIRSSNGAFLQQPHQFSHSISYDYLSVALYQNVQLGILAGLRFFSGRIKASFGSDGSTSRFEDLGDVRTIGNSPTSFFYDIVR